MLGTTATTILDYLRVLVWPVVALLIAFMFRVKLRELIDRLREFGLFGVHGKLDPPGQRQDPPAAEEAGIYAEGLDLVEYYEEQLVEHETEVEQLRQQLAVAEVRLGLEEIWNRIYGSQVTSLQQLRGAPNGLTREALQRIHTDAVTHRGLLLDFDQWMVFLLRPSGPGGGLAMLTPDGTYHITQKGIGLLGYGEVSGYGFRPY
jgi:hypothetical protein